MAIVDGVFDGASGYPGQSTAIGGPSLERTQWEAGEATGGAGGGTTSPTQRNVSAVSSRLSVSELALMGPSGRSRRAAREDHTHMFSSGINQPATGLVDDWRAASTHKANVFDTAQTITGQNGLQLTLTSTATSSWLKFYQGAAPNADWLIGAATDNASTNEFGIRDNGQGITRLLFDSAGKMWIDYGAGADTNLYRSAADTLRTDDSFYAAPGKTIGVGPAAAATSTSSLTQSLLDLWYSTESFSRLQLGKDAGGSGLGGLLLGDGAGAHDTNLYRGAANRLQTDDVLRVGLYAVDNGSVDINSGYVYGYYAGEANARYRLNRDTGGGGKAGIEFGEGGATAVDTNIYRNAANALKTDDALEVVGALTKGGVAVSLDGHTHAGGAFDPALGRNASAIMTDWSMLGGEGTSLRSAREDHDHYGKQLIGGRGLVELPVFGSSGSSIRSAREDHAHMFVTQAKWENS